MKKGKKSNTKSKVDNNTRKEIKKLKSRLDALEDQQSNTATVAAAAAEAAGTPSQIKTAETEDPTNQATDDLAEEDDGDLGV